MPWLIFVPKQENATEPRQEPEQAPTSNPTTATARVA